MVFTAFELAGPLQLLMQLYQTICIRDMGTGVAKMLRTVMSRIPSVAD